MRNDPTLRAQPADGWLGTLELPGYRAGSVVAKLDDLPEIDPDHLYFDLLLLDAGGHTQDNHSGPCRALARQRPLAERSRFVRVVAELVRHASSDTRSLTALGQALSFIRECGVEQWRLIAAAQLLDDASSEHAVAQSLNHLLQLALGEDEARRAMCDVVVGLARDSGFGPLDSHVSGINDGGLAAQVGYVVRTVGKARARRYLRHVTDFEMVPKPDMFGV